MGKQKHLTCNSCGKEKSISNFYISYSDLYKNIERIPICKDCIVDIFEYYLKKFGDDKKSVYYTCRKLDVFFDSNIFEGAKTQSENQDSHLMRIYIQKVNSMIQYKQKTFDDSENLNKETSFNIENKVNKIGTKVDDNQLFDLKTKWGEDFSNNELKLLEETYANLSEDKNLKYNSSKQYLKLATIYYVRSLSSAINGQMAEAEKYTKMFNETMKMGEFTPSALAKNSSTERLGSFSDFSLMLEEVVDLIDLQKILPQYMKSPKDEPDKVILYVINYMQESLGHEISNYEDIYKFYQKMEEDAKVKNKKEFEEEVSDENE